MKKISRAKAIEKQSLFYYTGVPCTRGHLSRRRVSNYSCEECKIEDSQEYRNRNKTGYSRGRPKKGEIRPVSKLAQSHKQWLEKKLEEDPQYILTLNKRQQDWKNNNKEQSQKIKRNSYYRNKNWKNAKQVIVHNDTSPFKIIIKKV